jgi:hypothetical protein
VRTSQFENNGLPLPIRHTYSFLPNHHHAPIIATATEEAMIMMPTISMGKEEKNQNKGFNCNFSFLKSH